MQTGRGPGDTSQADQPFDPATGPIHPLVSRAPPRWFTLTLLGVIAAAAWLPILAVLATIGTVIATGCHVDEASAHPCVLAGHDIGDALGTGLLLAFVAGPTTLLALGASVVWVILWRRHRRSGSR